MNALIRIKNAAPVFVIALSLVTATATTTDVIFSGAGAPFFRVGQTDAILQPAYYASGLAPTLVTLDYDASMVKGSSMETLLAAEKKYMGDVLQVDLKANMSGA